MNISEVGQQISSMLSKSGSLFISSGDNFARELTLGQVIKGKVLRSFDGDRYQVEFAGQKKTVDSSIPLQAGEVIQGRVVNVGEQIEIKRLPLASEKQGQIDRLNIRNETGFSLTSRWEKLLIQGMRDFNVKFSTQQRADIINVMKQSDRPLQVVLSAAAMSKQKIAISQDVLLLLDKLHNNQKSLSLFDVEQPVPRLTAENNIDAATAQQVNSEDIKNMAAVISQLVAEQESKARSETKNSDNADDKPAGTGQTESSQQAVSGQANDNELPDNTNRSFSELWYLMNNQVDGSVQHRVSTLPFWVNDRLIEVDVVMYEQKRSLQQQSGIESKRIVFSLDLDNLGQVNVEILLNNKHVKMAISTESSGATQSLLAHGVELTQNITDQNWSVDEMSYLTEESDKMGNVIGSVLEHYVAQDSLSRLM